MQDQVELLLEEIEHYRASYAVAQATGDKERVKLILEYINLLKKEVYELQHGTIPVPEKSGRSRSKE